MKPPSARARVSRWTAVIAALACLAFARVVTFDFAYDDSWTIVRNRALLRPWSAIVSAAIGGEASVQRIPDATRPSMISSMWLDRAWFALEPAGYHLHSLLLYAATCAAATLALLSLSRRLRVAVIGGALFAVAPIHAEVVASINYREDLMAAAGIFTGIAWVFAPRRPGDRTPRVLVAAAIWLWALLGKESAAALPLMVLGVLVVRRPSRRWYRLRAGTWWAFGAVGAGWAVWRGWLEMTGSSDVPYDLAQPVGAERILRLGRYVAHSAYDGLVALDWSPEHAPLPVARVEWWGLVAALLAFVAVGARRRATEPLAIGVLLAITAPLVSSPIVAPLNELADRYAFTGVLGGALFWGTILDRVAKRIPRRLHGLGALLVLAGPTWVAQRATEPWKNNASLWQAATQRAPDSPRAWTGLSRALRDAGQLELAQRTVERAIALDPRFLRARVTRTYNLLAAGDTSAARAEIQTIEELGGRHQYGMRRARYCAQLPPSAAPRCVGYAAAD